MLKHQAHQVLHTLPVKSFFVADLSSVKTDRCLTWKPVLMNSAMIKASLYITSGLMIASVLDRGMANVPTCVCIEMLQNSFTRTMWHCNCRESHTTDSQTIQ